METPGHDQLLKRVPFLSDLTPDELRKLSALLVAETHPAGTVIFEENSLGNVFYIITSGRVEITKHIPGRERQSLAIGEVADFFGEMALLEHRPRSATVRALEPTSTLKMSQRDFDSLLVDSPRAYQQIARALSSRLRDMNQHLIEFLQGKNDELQRAYDLLKETQSMLIAKEKLATLGMVAGRIIHDIKHPITTILGHVELIRMQSTESAAHTDMIVREMRRLTDMVEEVLDFAHGRDTDLSVAPHRLGDFLNEALFFIQAQIGGRPIHLETDLRYRGDAVFDHHKLRRVLYNLVSNAVDALPPDGGTLRIQAYADGRTLVLSVFDSGPGIPPDIAERLFEPFVTAGKLRGTGLGLAICKNIVEAHRGTIGVEHVPGIGTTFVVKLTDSIA